MVYINDLMLPMSDGVHLYTRIIKPGDGKYPTVFMRTPYDNDTVITDETHKRFESHELIRHGYAIIMQHCRGSGGSEGVCIPYADEERRDGLDTLKWLRTLPHYNGELFLLGGSYTASVLLMLLNDDIPDLKALVINVQTESMYHRNYFNGMCRSFCGFTWWLSMISRHYPKINDYETIFKRPYKDIIKRAIGEDMPAFTNQILHNRFDDFWQNDPRIGAIEKLRVPVLFVGGWFDYYCYGMCRMWEKLPAKTRARSCFLMSPFGHDLSLHDPSDYPLDGGVLPRERNAVWFDHVRLGTTFPFAKPGEFRYYSIGEDRWHSAKSPYEQDPSKTLYFTAEKTLARKKPNASSLSFIYDPENPKHHDKHDYMFLCYKENSCEDVLSFVSEPFNENTSFFGPVSYKITATSDCDDTAFFIRLYLVENGNSYNIVDAATTLLHADPSYTAGKPCTFNIYSQPTAFLVKKGCRLRVDISSYSDCFAPHANTAEPFATAKSSRVAKNTVLFGESVVLLPKK